MTEVPSRLPAWLLLASLTACGPGSAPPEAAAPAASAPALEASTPAAPPFTEVQVERGVEVFRDVCAECHYRSDFRGTQFQFEWRRRSVGDLYEVIVETMPEKDPGGLDPQEYIDVVSFILSLNGFTPGADELVPDAEALQAYSMAPPRRGASQ